MKRKMYRIAATALVVVTVAVGCEKKQEQEAAKLEPAKPEVAAKEEGAVQKSEATTVTTASGLKYVVITPGTGKKATLTDSVTVNYRGTLTNGTEFDSSYKRGKPATFPVGGVIKGWTEALQLMQEGAKWKLTIPPDLAYGSRGAGGVIGPNETLIFEVELIKVN